MAKGQSVGCGLFVYLQNKTNLIENKFMESELLGFSKFSSISDKSRGPIL